MSINLHCEQMDLWQTPSHITSMCYSNEDGGWKGIRYRYIEWVKSHTNGVWNDHKELEEMRQHVNAHIAEVMSHEHLEFYCM